MINFINFSTENYLLSLFIYLVCFLYLELVFYIQSLFSISRRKKRELQYTNLVLLSSPNNPSVILKLKANLVLLEPDVQEKLPLEKCEFILYQGNLDLVIVLNLCLMVICFFSGLGKLILIFGTLTEIQHLLVLILWISCGQFSSENLLG